MLLAAAGVQAGSRPFLVASKPYGIILRDGSRISGVLRDKDKDNLHFRSTTFGLIKVPKSEVAGYFYQGVRTPVLETLPTHPCVITRSGKIETVRKVLWADQMTAAVLSAKGMRKYGADELSYVVVTPFALQSAVILRNGDVLNMPIVRSEDTLTVRIGGKPYSVSPKAVRKTNLQVHEQYLLRKDVVTSPM